MNDAVSVSWRAIKPTNVVVLVSAHGAAPYLPLTGSSHELREAYGYGDENTGDLTSS